MSDLFGDVEDIEVEENDANGQTADGDSGDSLIKSKENLQGMCSMQIDR